MPAILPMKVIKVGTSAQTRIAQACDRCKSKKIRCDGIRPSCTQCVNVGFECKTSDKPRRGFPRGYTESLEERVRCLEREARELLCLIDERDTTINTLCKKTTSEATNWSEGCQKFKGKPSNDVRTENPPVHGGLQVTTLEFTSKGSLQHEEGHNMSREDISKWIQGNLVLAKDATTAPSIRLIVTYTPDDTTDEDYKTLPRRQLYEDVRDKLEPVLMGLNVSEHVIGTFDRVVFDKFAIKAPKARPENRFLSREEYGWWTPHMLKKRNKNAATRSQEEERSVNNQEEAAAAAFAAANSAITLPPTAQARNSQRKKRPDVGHYPGQGRSGPASAIAAPSTASVQRPYNPFSGSNRFTALARDEDEEVDGEEDEEVDGEEDEEVEEADKTEDDGVVADMSCDFIYHIGFGFFSLAYRHFPESKTAIGVLLIQNHKEMAAKLTKDLVGYRDLIGLPNLLPFVAQRAIDVVLASWLKLQKEAIIEAQAETGYHQMLSLTRTKTLVNYTELSTKVTGTAINIVTTELCWQILAEYVDSLIHEPNRETHITGSQETSALNQNATAFLQDEMCRSARNIQTTLLEVKSWQQKATIMVQGLFNLIAQQDQNTSIGIARDSKMIAAESKRDSTSMKTIAVVTMTFLPGTFIAAIFSIPMFQWDATSPTDVVNKRFWIYWSITIPLTLLAFLVWFFRIRYTHDEKNDSRWATRGAAPTPQSTYSAKS